MLNKAIVFGEDERSKPLVLGEALRACVVEVFETNSDTQTIALADRFLPDCALILHTLELRPGILRLMEQVRRIDHGCPILLLARSISTVDALDAMRAGAGDLLGTNASLDEIQIALRSIITRRCGELRSRTNDTLQLACMARMVGHSPAIAEVRNQILKAAASDANVLITGESGTGKEVAAELIHQNSRRKGRKFVALNCAAIPDALLESELFGYERGAFTGANTARDGKLQCASGGTLFLDEIGDMPLSAQAKILRAIESRVIQRLGSNVDMRVQIRLVAATNQNLELLTQEKRFRQDLYFRLNVVRIALPPLRERPEDIPVLAEHFLQELSVSRPCEPIRSMEADVMRRFEQHDWPGNVRELRNVIESILVFSSSRRIGLADIPGHIRQRLHSNLPAYSDERSKILVALNSSEWNREKAASILHCSRMTLYRKMVKYSIPTTRES